MAISSSGKAESLESDEVIERWMSVLSSFPGFLDRWNKNEVNSPCFTLVVKTLLMQEIASILESASLNSHWICSVRQERPPSGSVILFERKDGQYYKVSFFSSMNYLSSGETSEVKKEEDSECFRLMVMNGGRGKKAESSEKIT